MAVEMTVEILADGVIKCETGNMAGEYHASADEFLKLVEKLAGGTRETKSTRGNVKAHTHQHASGEHHHHH